jgi:hypothetical protein
MMHLLYSSNLFECETIKGTNNHHENKPIQSEYPLSVPSLYVD